MENVNVYLSGGMGNLNFEEQSKWRQQIQNAIKFNYECEKKPIFFNPVNYYNFEEVRYKSGKEIIEFDLNALRKSDLVIVNFNDPKSIGTAMELILAKEMHIPVIGWNSSGQELHPWLREGGTRMCNDHRETVEYVVEFYLN